MKSHILIVDDDPRVTDLVRRILAYEGYSVAIASSGNDALTRTLERPPDLIVLDFMLPGIDAWRWCGGCAPQGTTCRSSC